MKACCVHYGGALWKGCLNLRVKRIIPMLHFWSVLVYRHWLLPVNSPWISENTFLKGSNDRSTVGEYFGTGFYQYYSRHGAQVKNNVQNESCKFLNADFSPQFLMHPAGFTWFKIMRPLWESCVWDAGRAGKKITAMHVSLGHNVLHSK